eukprot:COSAG02_NODE_32579_length_514_cov_0.816867_2_plen_80_part_01
METWNRYLLTEIYILCHACSCQEILRMELRVGTPGTHRQRAASVIAHGGGTVCLRLTKAAARAALGGELGAMVCPCPAH